MLSYEGPDAVQFISHPVGSWRKLASIGHYFLKRRLTLQRSSGGPDGLPEGFGEATEIISRRRRDGAERPQR